MLKSVLALLLSKFVKKSDTEFIASQPMASAFANAIMLYDNYKGDMTVNGVAATNGWVLVTCGNALRSVIIKNEHSLLSTRMENYGSDQYLLQWPHLYLPCAKGDSFTVSISVKQGQSDGNTIRFIPSIGG